VIPGKPWFNIHSQVVDWRLHQLRIVIDDRIVAVDASASTHRKSSRDITRISATQVKKVARRQELIYLVHLSQFGVEQNPPEDIHLSNAWECMLDEFSDVFIVDIPGIHSERSVSMEIELKEGAKPMSKPSLRLSPAEIYELKNQLSLSLEREVV
jgi:hypothetical protein